MKIKHWQGYGHVNAVRKNTSYEDGLKIMTIVVSGNHEYGICRNDKYNVFNWLLRRFDKNVTDYRCIQRVDTFLGYDSANKCDICAYKIAYRSDDVPEKKKPSRSRAAECDIYSVFIPDDLSRKVEFGVTRAVVGNNTVPVSTCTVMNDPYSGTHMITSTDEYPLNEDSRHNNGIIFLTQNKVKAKARYEDEIKKKLEQCRMTIDYYEAELKKIQKGIAL